VGSTHQGVPGGGGVWRAMVGCSHPGAPLRSLLAPVILLFDRKILAKFRSIPRTFISAQKQHHGSSAENIVRPGLVSFKSCKLESKTRGKALGKVDMLEMYQVGEDLPACCHHQSPCVKLVAFEYVDGGRKFLACAKKVRPSFVVTNHLLDVIQTLSRSQPIHTTP
jgi:hypothetical protein